MEVQATEFEFYEELPQWLKVSFILFLVFFIMSLIISFYTTFVLFSIFMEKFAAAYFIIASFAMFFVTEDPANALLLNAIFLLIIIISFILAMWRDDAISHFTRKKTVESMITLPEAFLSCMALSLVIVLIFPIKFQYVSENINEYLLLKFAYQASIVAPIMEELTFRVLFLLFPLAVIYALKSGDLSEFKIVVSGKKEIGVIELVLIVFSAILFGYTHYAVGTWSFTKIYQASLMGLFLGYIAVKKGVPSSLCLHWLINSFATFIVVVVIYNQPLVAALILLGFIFFFFAEIGIGFYALVVIIIKAIKRLSERKISEEKVVIEIR